jgi:hypothetical protein
MSSSHLIGEAQAGGGWPGSPYGMKLAPGLPSG